MNLIVSYCEPSDGIRAHKAMQCIARFSSLMLPALHDCVLCRLHFLRLFLLLHTGCSVPLDLRMRRILLPVTTLTCAIPCESRRATPICDGVAPLRAILQICSTTCSGVVLSHAGGVREYGTAEEPKELNVSPNLARNRLDQYILMPFPLL